MTSKSLVRLIALGESNHTLSWPLGPVTTIQKSPSAIHDFLRQNVERLEEDALLFWDASLEPPDPEVVQNILPMPGDVWHAGLKLGLAGLPGSLDFVHPNWMLNRDPDANIVATSWRLSLEACLIRVSVLRQLGSVHPEFKTLDAASLELGHRFLMSGAIVRHVPHLLGALPSKDSRKLPFPDECLFLLYRAGRRWTYWALGRALLTGYASLQDIVKAYRIIRSKPIPPKPPVFKHTVRSGAATEGGQQKVSILIPTLDRYEYLRNVLAQLKNQTVRPLEIIVVDQTSRVRDIPTLLTKEFPDLPLKILHRDRPGQCSSRNAGLRIARGDCILFLDDDDDDLPSDLIERHLECLRNFQATVSAGACNEVGIETLPESFTYLRCSDVFPTNNTLIHKDVLAKSGLFDLALDRGEMEDFDLGMRIYLTGHLMILNPDLRVSHHHAPTGGLRAHGSRVITYALSRKSLLSRKLPSVSEIYIRKHFFQSRQFKEGMILAIFGTLSFHGNIIKKILKFVTGIFLLPYTLWQIRKNTGRADQLLKDFTQYPELSESRQQPVSSLP